MPSTHILNWVRTRGIFPKCKGEGGQNGGIFLLLIRGEKKKKCIFPLKITLLGPKFFSEENMPFFVSEGGGILFQSDGEVQTWQGER